MSDAIFYLVGVLKLASAATLLPALWMPFLTLPAASVLAALMPGAIAMHRKVRDPILKSVPALAMLAMTATLAVMKSA